MSQPSNIYYLNPPSTLVDDADPTIQYNGTWNAANETEIQSGSADFNDRMPLFNTLHVLQVFDGSFSYNFTGGGISVFATPVDNSTYSVKCLLDGNQLSFNANATKAQFGQSQPVCQAFGLPDNTIHMISVAVSVPPRDQQDDNGALSGFAFDYMLIQLPSGVAPWDNGTQDVFLPVLDTPDIFTGTNTVASMAVIGNTATGTWIANLSRGWEFDPENGFYTLSPGAQFNVTFTGVSLWWYGYVPTKNRTTYTGPSPAAFSIDGGTPSAFTVPPLLPDLALSQSLLFKTPVLGYGAHTLSVVHNGTIKTWPLTLQMVLIQKFVPTVLVASSTVGLLPTTTVHKQPTSPLSAKHGNLGGTVGGVSGGVVFLLLLAFGVCALIRWTRKRRHFTQTGGYSTTVVPEPFPPPTNENSQIRLPRKAQPGQEEIDNPFMQQEIREPPLNKWARHHTVSNNATDSQTRPASTNIVNDNSAAGQGDTQRPATPDIGISTRVEALRGTDEVDGLSDRPPLYTAQ